MSSFIPRDSLSEKIDPRTISGIKYELGRFLKGSDAYAGKLIDIVYGSCRYADGIIVPSAQDGSLSDGDRSRISELVETPLISISLLFESHIDNLRSAPTCNVRTIASLLVAYRVMKDSGIEMLPPTDPCRSIAVANLERSLAIIALETTNSAVRSVLTSVLSNCQSLSFIAGVLDRPLDTVVTLPVFKALSLSDYHQPLLRGRFARAMTDRGFIILNSAKLVAPGESKENWATEEALTTAELPARKECDKPDSEQLQHDQLEPHQADQN